VSVPSAHVRARLWWGSRIDRTAIWLCNHGHHDAALLLWKVTGSL